MTTIREQRNQKRLARLKRDTEICELYLGGMTLEDCARRFKISRQRVKQIVKAAKVWRPRVASTNDRDEFLGVNVNGSDKIALRLEAERRGVSMSQLTSDLIKDMIPRPSLAEEIAAREAELAEIKAK